MSEAPADSRPPRGALIVVAVGLLACLAAALLSTDKSSGAAANLEWVQEAKVPDSAPADVPGGSGQMQLVKGELRSTGTNVSGYSVFLAGATLRVDAGSPIEGGHILCTVDGHRRAEIAHTFGGLRATFPRSSEAGIRSQEVPESLLINFSARGGEYVVIEPHVFRGFTSERGVKLEWPKYETGTEHLDYLVVGKPKHDLVLPFYTVWKTTTPPGATISCTLRTNAGKATVRTAAEMAKIAPPIDEEAEEHAEERAEEEDEEAEEAEQEAAEQE